MTASVSSHSRPRRAGHERSRNGCSTCRARRVKCDEGQPHCRRCTDSGRKCEGPTTRRIQFVQERSLSPSTTATPPVEVSLLAPRHPDDERRAFDFFMHCATPVLGGVLDARLWRDLIPRLSQTYDFVWDTIVAGSLLFEHVDYRSLSTTFDRSGSAKVVNHYHRQALKLYNRAIAGVRLLAERHEIDSSMMALSYILFSSVEFHQRNVKTGSDLVKQCCSLVKANLNSLPTRQNSIADQVVQEVVAPCVMRKAVDISTLGDTLPPRWSADNEVNSPLNIVLSNAPALNAARIEFHALAYRCYETVRLTDWVPNVVKDDPNRAIFMASRDYLLHDLKQWRAFYAVTARQASPDPEVDWLGSYLLMYYAICRILLQRCDSIRQTAFDDCRDLFVETIENASICLRRPNKDCTTYGLPADFDHGIFPMLYFCATKCRDPILRRRALALMHEAPQQENTWAFVAPERVVAKLIEVEENGLDGRSVLSPFDGGRPSNSILPPEKHRFAYASVVGRTAPTGRQRQALELCRFEEDASGTRRLITEYVWLHDEFEPGVRVEEI